MYCVVIVVRIDNVCCYGGTCTCFVLLQCYVYMFCVATSLRQKEF